VDPNAGLIAWSLIGGRRRSSQFGSVNSDGFQSCQSLKDFVSSEVESVYTHASHFYQSRCICASPSKRLFFDQNFYALSKNIRT
jgi:hypothetical protein